MSRVQVAPGALDTTRAPSAFGFDRAQLAHNINTARGIYERGPRYRRWQDHPERVFVTGSIDPGMEDAPADSAASESFTGSSVSWSNVSGAKVEGGTVAAATLSEGSVPHRLSFGFLTSIPSDAVVKKIRIKAKRRSNTAGPVAVRPLEDYAVLTVNGSVVGANAAADAIVPEAYEWKTYEWESGDFSAPILPSDINDGLLGAKLGWRSDVKSGTGTPANWSVAVSPSSPQTYGTEAEETTNFSAVPTWIGAGAAPPWAKVRLTATAWAGSSTTPPAVAEFSGTAEADNGLGVSLSGAIAIPTPGLGVSYLEAGPTSADYRVNSGATKNHAIRTEIDFTSAGAGTGPRHVHTLTATIQTPDSTSLEVDAVTVEIDYEVDNRVFTTYTEPQGIGIGRFGGFTETAVVYGRGAFDVDLSKVALAMGDDWSPERSDLLLATGRWSIWQFAKWLFYAHPTGGVYRREVGQAGWEPIYRDYDSPGSTGEGSTSISFPPYLSQGVFDKDADALNGTQSGAVPSGIFGSGVGANWNAEITATGEVLVTIPDTGASVRKGWIEIEVTLGSPRAWTGSDCLMVYLRQFGSLAAKDVGNDGFWDDASFNHVKLTNSSGASTTLPMQIKGPNMNGRYGSAYGWADMEGVGPSISGDVKKISVRFGVYRTGNSWYEITDIFLGSIRYKDMNSWTFSAARATGANAEGDVEYAYRATEGGTDGQARTMVVPAARHLGARLHPDLPFGGGRIVATVPVADAPFTSSATLQLFRKVEGTWRRVSTRANNGTLVFDDTLSDSAIAADTTTYPVTTLDFTVAPPSVSGVVTGIVAGCAWKGSNVYASLDGKIYFSRTSFPLDVLWENVVLTNDTGSEDLGPPRTSTLADDTVSPALCLMPAENLYCATRTEVYVFVSGETAATSSFPRKIDGARGALGYRAGATYGDRVVVGSDDGLWLIKKSSESGEQPDELTELTKDVRGSWRWLTQSNPQNTIVRSSLGDVWAFNGAKFLLIERDGRISTGEFADGRTVVDAATDPEVGVVLLMSDGSAGVVGPFPTDGGTDVGGTNGSAFRWVYRTGRMEESADVKRALARVGGTTPNVKVKAVCSDGEGEATFAKDGNLSFDRVNDSGGRLGGTWTYVEVSGNSTDLAYRVDVDIEPRDTARGGL